jgi:tetratricopeptide (TPR) repeat protein
VKDAPEILERVTAPPVSDKSVFFSSRRILKFAAAAILLILVAAGSYFMLRAPSSEKLFTSNFEPYPNMITTKSNVINEKAVAMLYYELNDWDSAIILLNQYLTKKSYTPDVMFYLGNAYLAKGDSEQAIRWLKEASTMSSGFDDQINWYLALAYLRQDDQGSARVYLETLCQKDDFYQLKAEKLLKKIR